MIRNNMVYPKTKRISKTDFVWQITEKMDGSNLTFFKFDDDLYLATRNNVFNWTVEKPTSQDIQYKGLFGWVENYSKLLYEKLKNHEALFGEWLGMGKIKYEDYFPRFNLFAYGYMHQNEDGKFEAGYINRDLNKIADFLVEHDLNRDFITVPFVDYTDSLSPDLIDWYYNKYRDEQSREVEGFILTNLDSGEVRKYVRYKGGKMLEHWK